MKVLAVVGDRLTATRSMGNVVSLVVFVLTVSTSNMADFGYDRFQ